MKKYPKPNNSVTKFAECKLSNFNHFPLQSLKHYNDLSKIFNKISVLIKHLCEFNHTLINNKTKKQINGNPKMPAL